MCIWKCGPNAGASQTCWKLAAFLFAFSSLVATPAMGGNRRQASDNSLDVVSASRNAKRSDRSSAYRQPAESQAQPAPDVRSEEEFTPIGQLTLDTSPSKGELPPDYSRAKGRHRVSQAPTDEVNRGWMAMAYNWRSTAFCHRPLYFEDVNLERHGYTCGMGQPLVSGAHFFGNIAFLPYKMAAIPRRECIYVLGYYRPGNSVPYRGTRLPWSPRGAVVQAAAVTGAAFLIP